MQFGIKKCILGFGLLINKDSTEIDFTSVLGKNVLDDGDKKNRAMSLLKSLDETRNALLAVLRDVSNESSVLDTTLSEYLALFAAMTDTAPTSDIETGMPESFSSDLRLALAIEYQWRDVLIQSKKMLALTDAHFEIASVTSAAGLWKLMKAASAFKGIDSSVPIEEAASSHRLLKEAAGLFLFAHTISSSEIPPGSSMDLQLLLPLSVCCLADAQSIALYRGQSKGNDPNLLSSLASDAAMQYKQVYNEVFASGISGAEKSPFAQYVSYKECEMRILSMLHAGVAFWRDKETGKGLRVLTECTAMLAAYQNLGRKFNEIATKAEVLHLVQEISKVYRSIKADNDTVYYQKVPKELPALPDERRVVSAIPFVLPPPAPLVKEGVLHCFKSDVAKASSENNGKLGHENSEMHQSRVAFSLWRWLLFIVVAPLLMILSIIGMLIWVLLLPLKCFCAPCGMALQAMSSAVLGLVKLPLKGVMYANGTP